MKKQSMKQYLSLLLTLCLIVSLFTGLGMSASAVDVAVTSDGYTVSENGTYALQAGSTGTITIAAGVTEVTLKGLGSESNFSNLKIDATETPGISLTLEDIRISNSAGTTVNFSGANNRLSFEGENVIDLNSGDCLIHVGVGTSLTIGGAGTAYLYKSSQGAGIGGVSGEMNGDITFAMTGALFMKGSKQGAVIGAGANASSTTDAPGFVKFESGTYNLMSIARGACIGGSAGASGGSTGTTVYFNGGSVNINVDYTGAAVGGGGYATGNDASGGTAYFGGGSVRIYVDKNAVSNSTTGWNGVTYAQGINNVAMTAQRLNNETDGTPVYLCVVDTSGIAPVNGIYTVKVDGTDFYTGGLHQYKYVDEDNTKGTTAITSTPDNWAENDDTHLYLYLTGADHTVDINGTAFTASYNNEATADEECAGGAFTVANAPNWYDAESITISTAEELRAFADYVNAGNDMAGKTVTLGADIALAADGLYSAIENVTYGTTSYPMTTTQYVLAADAPIWTPIGSGTASSNTGASGNAFAGTFDGAGHTISGVYTGTKDASAGNTDTVQGLFGIVSGTVKNVTVSGCITGKAVVGGIVAHLAGGTVENCVNQAIVFADGGTTPNGGVENGGSKLGAVGGIVGNAMTGSTVVDCVNNAPVSCANTYKGGRVGGIIGLIDGAAYEVTIARNGNTGAIAAYQYAAGIVGMNYSKVSPIDSCFNSGSINGYSSGSTYIGGISGTCNSDITNCINTGDYKITNSGKSAHDGGIVSDFGGSKIENCYNTGMCLATGSSYGAICGTGYGTAAANKLINCYTVEGTVGEDINNECVTVKTEAEMKSAAFASLLGDAFKASYGEYPVLSWQEAVPAPDFTPVTGETVDGVTTVQTGSGENAVLASVTAPEEGWVEGENTFTVSSEGDVACVVIVMHSDGSYALVAATTSDGIHSFTATLSAGDSITVAVKGDANGDGVFNAQDVMQAKAASLGKLDCSPLQTIVSDASGDGTFNAQDVMQAKAASLGKLQLAW